VEVLKGIRKKGDAEKESKKLDCHVSAFLFWTLELPLLSRAETEE